MDFHGFRGPGMLLARQRKTGNEFQGSLTRSTPGWVGGLSMSLGLRKRAIIERHCESCGSPAEKACSGRAVVFYCNPKCQKLHREQHRDFCKRISSAV